MDSAETGHDEIRSVEDVHLIRLMSILHEMVRGGGLKGAARELGIDHRTVGASLERGRPTRRCREALERYLVEKVDSDLALQRERLDALEPGVLALGEEVRSGLDGLRSDVDEQGKALREELKAGLGRLGRRLAEFEEAGVGGAVPHPPAQPDGPPPPGTRPRREHPGLVTREPADDDPDVFGAAWPLVQRWRELKDSHPNEGGGIEWLAGEERLLEIELALLFDHGMTLPPETEPLRGFGRAGQLNWRREALADARRALARRRLVRWILDPRRWRRWPPR